MLVERQDRQAIGSTSIGSKVIVEVMLVLRALNFLKRFEKIENKCIYFYERGLQKIVFTFVMASLR